MVNTVIEKLTELIGPWNPITTEGAFFEGVDVQWCFGCIVVVATLTIFGKFVMCFFK